MTTTTTPRRHRARWTVSELNNLHSEYEMKELTVQEIAAIHNRTVYGIMNQLQSEGLIDSMDTARGFNENKQTVSLKPAIQFDDDEDMEQDDPSDEDYVPEDMDVDDDDEDEDEEEFDPYSLKQKVAFLEQQVKNIISFLQTALPKQKIVAMAK